MIRRAADSIRNSTGEKLNVSLREFPKNGSNASRVEPMHVYILTFLDLQRFLQQAANISIKINTTKEFVTDRDQDQDMDKTDVWTRDLHCSWQIAYVSYFQASDVQVFEDKNKRRSFPDV